MSRKQTQTLAVSTAIIVFFCLVFCSSPKHDAPTANSPLTENKFGITFHRTNLSTPSEYTIKFTLTDKDVAYLKSCLELKMGTGIFTTTHNGDEINHASVKAQDPRLFRKVKIWQDKGEVFHEKESPIPLVSGEIPGSFQFHSNSFDQPLESGKKLFARIYFGREYKYRGLIVEHNLLSSITSIPID